jgi:uncharacterized repeat protein (TIGR03806 family)
VKLPRWALALAGLASLSASPSPVALDLILGDTLPPRLSDFRFFDAGKPNGRVLRYELIMPLFSDFAEKNRFVFVPEGKKAGYRADGVFDFPVGSALIKTFGYVDDPRKAGHRITPIETRVLLRRQGGWVALPYVWDTDGSDALLVRGGRRLVAQLKRADGSVREIDYAVPNANQCKGCHDSGGALTPIGPKARNLNDGNQLALWQREGLLDTAPADAPFVLGMMGEPATLETRARAYLDVNCGHCHNREGPANTSGLWLDWNQPRDVNYGIGKRPTAAGRGSGAFDFDIAPGQPDQSIFIHRMKSLDPGVAMPELGRSTVHDEGVALVSDWIRTLK